MNYSLVILKHFDLFGRTVKNQTVFKKKGISFQNKTIRRDELVVITLRLSTINTLLTSWLMKLWDHPQTEPSPNSLVPILNIFYS